MPCAPYDYKKPNAIFKSGSKRFSPPNPATQGPIYQIKDPRDIANVAGPMAGQAKGQSVFVSKAPRFEGNKDQSPVFLKYAPTSAPMGRVISGESAFKSKSKRFTDIRPSTSIGFAYNYTDPREIKARTANTTGGKGTAMFRSRSERWHEEKNRPKGTDPLLVYPSDITSVVSKNKANQNSVFKSKAPRMSRTPQPSGPGLTSYIPNVISAPSDIRAAASAFKSKSPRFVDKVPATVKVDFAKAYPSDIAAVVKAQEGKKNAVFASKSARLRSHSAGSDPTGSTYKPPEFGSSVTGGAISAFKSKATRFKDVKPVVNAAAYKREVKYPTDVAVEVEDLCKK